MGFKMTLLRLKSDLTAWSRLLTWPWLAAFALLAACAGFYLSVVLPAKHTLADTQAHLTMLQNDEESRKQNSQGAVSDAPADQLDAFYQAFPLESTVPDTVEKMIKLAQSKGLSPKQAQYRIVKNNPGELMSYQIALPVKGAYPKIMNFAFELLSEVPNLSLDNVSFERQKIGDSIVETTLKMTLYIKRGQLG